MGSSNGHILLMFAEAIAEVTDPVDRAELVKARDNLLRAMGIEPEEKVVWLPVLGNAS